MTRTTIDLDPGVLKALRRLSATRRTSMGQVASELLARAVATQSENPAPSFTWVRRKLGVPLVDLEDKEAVRRVAEGSR